MEQVAEIDFLDIDENNDYIDLANRVIKKCFEVENLFDTKFYISITFTNPKNIREINNNFRKIDKETDVLSFPMFEKNEIEKLKSSKMEHEEVLGDIVISIEQVIRQAKEYGHSFERELSYMIVHGFYHIMGEDHIKEQDKVIMREKEENVLGLINDQK